MSLDPISFTIALTSLILGVWSHVRHSKCGICEIDMQSNAPTISIELDPNILLAHAQNPKTKTVHQH